MIIQDDRTKEELTTHNCIVAMTDKFMSGWGQASGGISYAGWACTWKDIDKVKKWVRSRSDASRVRVVGGDWRPERKNGHAHIYVVHDGHPSLD